MVNDRNGNYDVLGLHGVDRNWKICATHRALYGVTLHVDHLLATPHMNHSTC